MCRHFGWLGETRTLADLMLDPPHGLLTQSYRPRRQRHGLLNADGWGVGFYPAERGEPARWRSNRPLWSDASFRSVAPTIAAHCVLGALRSATVGMPGDESACAPFQSGSWLLSHNGVVDRDTIGPQAGAESMCDAAQLAAYVFARDPAEVGKIVVDVARRDPGARLNLLLTDGTQLLATTWGDTLSTLQTERGVLVASEPFDDDPEWTDVPDRCLVHVVGERITVTELRG